MYATWDRKFLIGNNFWKKSTTTALVRESAELAALENHLAFAVGAVKF